MPTTTDLALRKQSEPPHGDSVKHAYRGSAMDSALRGRIAKPVQPRSRGHDEDQLTEMLVWLATVVPKVATKPCGLALRVIVLGSGVC